MTFGDTQSDPIVLKIFPPHILKNNFSQPHMGTFAKPHNLSRFFGKPTHNSSFAKESISQCSTEMLKRI
jgi:hypothetical protein